MSHKQQEDFYISAYEYQIPHYESYAGITFLYVLKGEINLQNYEYIGKISEGEMVLVNRNNEFSIQSDQHNIVLKLQISNQYFSRYYKNYFHYKYFLKDDEFPEYKKNVISRIKWLLAKLMMTKLQVREEVLLENNLLISDVMLSLVSYFKEENQVNVSTVTKYNKQIERIVSFMEDNYQQDISLKGIAEKEKISIAHLSRLFKKEVGVGFAKYLLKIRFEHAVADLINTNKPIYAIAEENHFTDTKSFIELFKEQYKTTPNQYRKNNIKFSDHLDETEEKINEASFSEVTVPANEVLPLLAITLNQYDFRSNQRQKFASIETQTIDVDSVKKQESLPDFEYVVFVGNVTELLKANVQKQILKLQEEAKISYIEVSYLISGTIITAELATDEEFSTYSPYQNSDIAISFLQKNNIALMPRIYFERVIVDTDGYLKKAQKFLRYCLNVYGMEYLQSWCFTFCTDSKKVEDLQQYFELYLLVKSALHAIASNLKIGFSCPNLEENLVEIIAKYPEVLEQSDYLGIKINLNNDFDLLKSDSEILKNEVFYLKDKIKSVKHLLEHNHLTKPLHLMEWNTLTGNTRRTNGIFFRGALIFHTLLGLHQDVKTAGLILNTEIQEEVEDNALINVQSIALFHEYLMPRPVFFVLSFLNRLRGKIIAQGNNYLITQYDKNYQIVLTNPTIFNPYLSIEKEVILEFKKKKIFTFLGLNDGIYQVRQHIFDQNNGALYNEHERFKTRYGFDHEIIMDLQKTAPQFNVYDEKIYERELTLLADLESNAIHFYELKFIEVLD